MREENKPNTALTEWKPAQKVWEGPSLPPLGRKGKILRNLLLTAVFAACIWGLYGYPLPTIDMEFRRMERHHLLEPTQIVLRTGEITVSHSHGPGVPPPKITQEQIIGLGEDYAVSFWRHPFAPNGNQLEYWPFEEQEGQVKLVPLLMFISDTRGEDWPDRESCVAVAALRLPEGTARGEMTVEAGEGPYQEKSGVLEHGLCLFAFSSRLSSYSSSWLEGLPYTLRFYNEAGELLLEQTGTVPRWD